MSTGTAISQQRAARSTRRLCGWALLAAGTLLAIIALPAAGLEYSYVWAARLLDHPMMFGAVGWSLVGIAGCLIPRRTWQQVLAGLTAGGIFLFWVGGVWSIEIFQSEEFAGFSGIADVDGTMQTHVLLGGFVDPYWEIRVEQTDRGLLNRRFTVGCVNGDGHSLERLAWSGGSLIVDTSAGTVAVPVDEDGHIGRARPINDATIDEGSGTFGGQVLESC
ncbi:hypothetical protein [Nocardioides sp. WS12]|uniref:hypothetical protein n=1 Tax=Nocardioides sp. WS12 TaxID=2486272 RepID=UPI0015F84FEA|nr:hypothetical protein [Nocardioides sp. WS12]